MMGMIIWKPLSEMTSKDLFDHKSQLLDILSGKEIPLGLEGISDIQIETRLSAVNHEMQKRLEVEAAASQQWEYGKLLVTLEEWLPIAQSVKEVVFDVGVTFDSALTILGMHGWQMVGVACRQNGNTFYFKRPIR